jgi:sRNA-binding carbon storage regulator CsrA
MLVITRKAGESVVVRASTGAMRVILLQLRDNLVRIGFSGSDEFTVIRPELLRRNTEADGRCFGDMGVCANCYENPCVCIAD